MWLVSVSEDKRRLLDHGRGMRSDKYYSSLTFK